MADRISENKRSQLMARIRSADTRPEKRVRQALFHAGFRFRLHVKSMPGTPDIVLPRFKTAVFVNGCFWHGHHCRKGLQRPTTNAERWNQKLDDNIRRDRKNLDALQHMGWKTEILWECELEQGIAGLIRKLRRKNTTTSHTRA